MSPRSERIAGNLLLGLLLIGFVFILGLAVVFAHKFVEFL